VDAISASGYKAIGATSASSSPNLSSCSLEVAAGLGLCAITAQGMRQGMSMRKATTHCLITHNVIDTSLKLQKLNNFCNGALRNVNVITAIGSIIKLVEDIDGRSN
jgi:hypothetical protein